MYGSRASYLRFQSSLFSIQLLPPNASLHTLCVRSGGTYTLTHVGVQDVHSRAAHNHGKGPCFRAQLLGARACGERRRPRRNRANEREEESGGGGLAKAREERRSATQNGLCGDDCYEMAPELRAVVCSPIQYVETKRCMI